MFIRIKRRDQVQSSLCFFNFLNGRNQTRKPLRSDFYLPTITQGGPRDVLKERPGQGVSLGSVSEYHAESRESLAWSQEASQNPQQMTEIPALNTIRLG